MDKNGILQIFKSNILITSVLSFFLCYSLYLNVGPKVDESEVVSFAVGFLNGDLDPHWYGYGTLPMYILSFIYYNLFIIFDFLGIIEDKLSYTILLFTSNYFFDLARFIFTLSSVLSFFVYSNLLKSVAPAKYISVLFLLLILVNYETIYYSNYVRVDNFLNFFIACFIFLIFNFKDNKLHVIKLGFVAACLACTKINSVSILPLVLIYFLWFYKIKNINKVVIQGLFYFISFTFFSFIMQPFGNVFIRAYNIFSGTIVENNFFSFSKEIHSSSLEVGISILKLLSSKVGILICIGFILSVIYIRKSTRIKLIIVGVITLFISPFLLYWEVTEYWFVPIFPLIYFLGILGYYDFYESIKGNLVNPIPFPQAVVYKSLPIIFVGPIVLSLLNNVNDLKDAYSNLSNRTNKMDLVEYLNSTMNQNDIKILVDGHYNYIMPELVADTYNQFVDMSNVLDYNRDENEWLQYAYKSYYINRKRETKYKAEVVRAFNIKDNSEVDRRKGSFLLVSPYVYERFLKNTGNNYPDKQLNTLNMFKDYYSFYLNMELIKRFDHSEGIVYELYFIK